MARTVMFLFVFVVLLGCAEEEGVPTSKQDVMTQSDAVSSDASDTAEKDTSPDTPEDVGEVFVPPESFACGTTTCTGETYCLTEWPGSCPGPPDPPSCPSHCQALDCGCYCPTYSCPSRAADCTSCACLLDGLWEGCECEESAELGLQVTCGYP